MNLDKICDELLFKLDMYDIGSINELKVCNLMINDILESLGGRNE